MLFPNLKPSVKTISIRLPESLLDSLKTLAHQRDVPYQSLVKMILAEQMEAAALSHRTKLITSDANLASLPGVVYHKK